MGLAGSCSVCSRPDRGQLERDRAAGLAVRHVAARHGVPEASLRRHFKRCRLLAAPAPALPTCPPPTAIVPLDDLKRVAAELGLPLAELVTCVCNHVDAEITTANGAEAEELLDLWGGAMDNPEYVAAVARG